MPEKKNKETKKSKSKKTQQKETQDNKSVALRKDIPVDMTWDLNLIYADDKTWEKAFKAYAESLEQVESPAGKLAKSGKYLLQACEYYEKLSRPLEKLYSYAHMMHDSDTADSKYTAMQQRTKFNHQVCGQNRLF